MGADEHLQAPSQISCAGRWSSASRSTGTCPSSASSSRLQVDAKAAAGIPCPKQLFHRGLEQVGFPGFPGMQRLLAFHLPAPHLHEAAPVAPARLPATCNLWSLACTEIQNVDLLLLSGGVSPGAVCLPASVLGTAANSVRLPIHVTGTKEQKPPTNKSTPPTWCVRCCPTAG